MLNTTTTTMPSSSRQAGAGSSSSKRVNGRGEEEMQRRQSSRSRDDGRGGGRASGVVPKVSASQSQSQHRYAPNGDPRQKRELRQEFRHIIGQTQEHRNNIADARPEQLSSLLTQATSLFERVEAPSESALDSRFLLNASDMGVQMAKSMKVGSDFDVDEFLSRCMRSIGGRLRKANANNFLEDDDEDDAIMEAMADVDCWDWNKLGRKAAKRTRRAMTMEHLLGPLEVTHTKRNVKRRTGVDKSAPVVNPTQLGTDDLVKNANETSLLVKRVSQRLEEVGGQEGVNYFRFAIDPHSFSNTVENMFHISFLIREGTASFDTETGEPILMACEAPESTDREQGLQRRQIVFELDMQVWRDLIKLYDIRESIIESRNDVHDANADTWTGKPIRKANQGGIAS